MLWVLSVRADKADAEAAQAGLVTVKLTGALGDPDGGWTGETATVTNDSVGLSPLKRAVAAALRHLRVRILDWLSLRSEARHKP